MSEDSIRRALENARYALAVIAEIMGGGHFKINGKSVSMRLYATDAVMACDTALFEPNRKRIQNDLSYLKEALEDLTTHGYYTGRFGGGNQREQNAAVDGYMTAMEEVARCISRHTSDPNKAV